MGLLSSQSTMTEAVHSLIFLGNGFGSLDKNLGVCDVPNMKLPPAAGRFSKKK